MPEDYSMKEIRAELSDLSEDKIGKLVHLLDRINAGVRKGETTYIPTHEGFNVAIIAVPDSLHELFAADINEVSDTLELAYCGMCGVETFVDTDIEEPENALCAYHFDRVPPEFRGVID